MYSAKLQKKSATKKVIKTSKKPNLFDRMPKKKRAKMIGDQKVIGNQGGI
jgi:hypothetical protein